MGKVLDMLIAVEHMQNGNRSIGRELKKACELNTSACYLKMSKYAQAKAACDKVLEKDNMSVKALYRRAQANYGLKNWSDCICDCKQAIDVDSHCKDARDLLKQALTEQR